MKLIKLLVVSILITVSSGCSTFNQNDSANSRLLSSLNTEQKKQYVNAKLLAESAVRQQQFDVASNNYLILARLIDSATYAAKAVRLAERAEDYIASLQAANLWNQIEPENKIALGWKILGLLRSHQNRLFQENLKKLLDKTKVDSPGQYLQIMESVLFKAAVPNSLKQLETFAKNNPEEPEPWLVLARLHELMDEKVTAIVLIDRALSVSPNFIPALELKGLVYLRSGKLQEAKKHLISSVEKNPHENFLKLQLAKILYQESDYQRAAALAVEILDSDQTIDPARYLLAAIYFLEHKYTESEAQFLTLLEGKYKLNTVYYSLGEINLEYGKKEIALQFFDAITSGENLTSARVNAAKILFENNRLDDALKRLRNVRTSVPREQVFLAVTEIEMLERSQSISKYRSEIEQSFSKKPTNIYLLTRALKIARNSLERKQLVNTSLTSASSARAYKALVEVAFSVTSQSGDNLLAIQLLNDYLRQFPKDLQLLYSRAMLKAGIDDIAGMELDLRNILLIDPSHIDALNALGYSLADQNIALDEAYQMIFSAFSRRPNSAAITDSMGWVLYRKGNLKNALKYLSKAWEQDPTAEVGAHFGEVLWFSDKKQQAKKVWQQAIKLEGTNKILVETLNRLKVN